MRKSICEGKYNKRAFFNGQKIIKCCDNEFIIYFCNKVSKDTKYLSTLDLIFSWEQKGGLNWIFKVLNCFHHIEISFSLDFLLAKICTSPALFLYLLPRFPKKKTKKNILEREGGGDMWQIKNAEIYR